VTPPAPTQLSPAFRLLIGGVLLICIASFVLAAHHPHRAALASIHESTNSWWTREARPTPAPTLHVMLAAPVRPIIVQAPIVRPMSAPPPQAKPTPCQICLERQMRYQRAIETGFGGNTGGMRQLPQVMQANGQPEPAPTPNIFAYRALNHE
jgi:hypothetical protein